jgi:hypothetical protein
MRGWLQDPKPLHVLGNSRDAKWAYWPSLEGWRVVGELGRGGIGQQ